MDKQPMRLSPLYGIHISAGATMTSLGHWQVATTLGFADEIAVAKAGVGIADLSDRAKIMIEGVDAGAMLESVLGGDALGINDVALVGETLYLARLRKDRYYVSGPTEAEDDLLDRLNRAAATSKSLVTVTDETDARTELLLIGPNASTCLRRVCGLDFHDSAYPTLTAKQTSVAKIRQLIVRCDKRELPAYIISGGQSNAIYLWGTLLEAGHDLKIGPIGRTAVDELWR